MDMYLTHQMEAFSRAYVNAVAAAAGYAVYRPDVDNDSIDIGFASRSTAGKYKKPRLDAQLKSSTVPIDRARGDFPLQIKLKNYDDLRVDHCIIPRILIVVVLPDVPTNWCQHNEDELAMRHCGYWVSLRGSSEAGAQVRPTVRVPRFQVFSPEGLRALMSRVAESGTI